MKKRKIGLALLLAPVLLLPGGAVWQSQQAFPESVDRLLEPLSEVCSFREVALSPDGKRIAWVEARRKGESSHPAIYVGEAMRPAAVPTRITAAGGDQACAEQDIAWSPDGSRLAFLSDKEKPGQFQVYVSDIANGSARKLTSAQGYLATPRWSPDGKQLAVLFTENAPRAAGPLQAATPDAGVVEEHVYEQRLNIIDPDSGRMRPVSPADLYVYEYEWSPDSSGFAAIAAHGSGDNNWYIAEIYTIGAANGASLSILKPATQIAIPRWSPDGKTIAFIGGLMSDEGVVGGEIFSVPATGGEPRNLTPDLKASASWFAWMPSGERIVFAENVDGAHCIAALDVLSGRVGQVWAGTETISAGGGSLSFSADGKTSAFVRQSFDQPPEIWAGDMASWHQFTHANGGQARRWGKAESIHWNSPPFRVQGWLIYPRDFDSSRRYPLMVSVHGGPAAARTPTWPSSFFDATLLSDLGYFVFYPNPRGSYGQGEAFTKANVKDFGYGDLRDILAGVDEIVRTLPVDNNRLGIMGWSYGGYMTMWAVTQTNRFRTAVAGAGIANWQSYYGENGIDQWMIPYFGASVYDDPAVYARSSPITFIKKVRTPTLILVGDRDVECPAPQSYEFWHALKTLGVPNQFVVYPNEGHGISDPEHRRDIMRRTVSWLDRYLKGTAASPGETAKPGSR